MIKLSRTGDRPLVFDGECLSEVENRHFSGKEQNRWFQLGLYKINGGDYVLHVGYRTIWQNETDIDDVTIYSSLNDIPPYLNAMAHHAINDYMNLPIGAQFEEKRELITKQLRMGFLQSVTELLKDFPENLSN